MSTLKPPSQGRGHRRSPSDDRRRQAAVLRRSNTGGPLSADEDGSTSNDNSTNNSNNDNNNNNNNNNMSPSTIPSPARDRSRSPTVPGMEQIRSTIASMVCRPEIYRPLPPNMIPQPFLTSSHAPKPDAPVEDLVAHGHFYAAAITSAWRLSNLPPTTSLATVFDLFYTRLACLSLINKQCLEIAAVESLELRDLTAAMYLDPITNEHVIPWHLRVLAVRLQSIGFKDWRRGVMSYYILAHDARQQLARARSSHSTSDEELWASRLHDLGIRVANMLVEMGDLEAAGRHLKTLSTESLGADERKRIAVMQIMVWLQIGNLRAAKSCLAQLYPLAGSTTSPILDVLDPPSSAEDQQNDYLTQVLHALTQMASGNFALAATEWAILASQAPTDEMISANRAICLLYTGEFSTAVSKLERTVHNMEAVPHHALLFNLCTFYELSTERAGGLKTGLVQRLAEKDARAGGWQRATVDFKMDGVGVRA